MGFIVSVLQRVILYSQVQWSSDVFCYGVAGLRNCNDQWEPNFPTSTACKEPHATPGKALSPGPNFSNLVFQQQMSPVAQYTHTYIYNIYNDSTNKEFDMAVGNISINNMGRLGNGARTFSRDYDYSYHFRDVHLTHFHIVILSRSC